MNFAVIRAGGKQYLVKEGDLITIQGEFGGVLLASIDDKIKIGTPLVADVVVKTEVVKEGRGPKIRVAKFKAKSRYRRVMGFRPKEIQLKILSIGEPVIARSAAPKQSPSVKKSRIKSKT